MCTNKDEFTGHWTYHVYKHVQTNKNTQDNGWPMCTNKQEEYTRWWLPHMHLKNTAAACYGKVIITGGASVTRRSSVYKQQLNLKWRSYTHIFYKHDFDLKRVNVKIYFQMYVNVEQVILAKVVERWTGSCLYVFQVAKVQVHMWSTCDCGHWKICLNFRDKVNTNNKVLIQGHWTGLNNYENNSYFFCNYSAATYPDNCQVVIWVALQWSIVYMSIETII